MQDLKYEILADFNLVVTKVHVDRQTAKFNSLPNFLAIQHIVHVHVYVCSSGNAAFKGSYVLEPKMAHFG